MTDSEHIEGTWIDAVLGYGSAVIAALALADRVFFEGSLGLMAPGAAIAAACACGLVARLNWRAAAILRRRKRRQKP
jgi:hypothetical protein